MIAMRPLLFVLAVLLAACVAPRDPAVDAAFDFQRTAMDLIAKDQERSAKLAGLRLGMTDAEVLAAVGPPTRRETLRTSDTVTEVWMFDGELRSLGTLTFEDGVLAQMSVL